MLKANRLQLTQRHFKPRCQALIATLLAALVLLLDAMVALPALHELVHPDAGQAGHQCAVTLFAHGQVDATTVEIFVPAPPVAVESVLPIIVSAFSPAIENLPAGRAPPASIVPLV